MKRLILIIFLILSAHNAFCTDFSKIDLQSESVPANLKTAPQIATYLTRNLTSPVDKVRTIYVWIAHNINYDVVKMKSNSLYYDPQELVDDVLLKRKGVCLNYASLFKECCKSVGIDSYVILGFVRQNGKNSFYNHAWNAVKINNEFYNIDVTWAAGYVDNDKFTRKFTDKYFLILPTDFINTHMPIDPVWQFSTHPISYNSFETGNLGKSFTKGIFNFKDSIISFSYLNKIQLLERKRIRITTCGISNQIVKDELASISGEIDAHSNRKIQRSSYRT